MHPEMCRGIAFEAARRSARVNPHELWAVLEEVAAIGPQVVVDLWSEPAVWWAWWSLGAHVVGVSASPIRPGLGFSGDHMPSSVVEIVADPREPVTRQRVADQVAGRPVDVLVLGGPDSEDGARANFQAYAPLMRPGGLVLVHGIANEQYPGIARFWSGLVCPDRKELVGAEAPDGYGIATIPRRETADHG